jgi:hypothetical protein
MARDNFSIFVHMGLGLGWLISRPGRKILDRFFPAFSVGHVRLTMGKSRRGK